MPAPFFSTASAPGRPAHRLLLLSRHFPPGTAVGALRWEKLVAHLAECGWAADVVTDAPDSLAVVDMSRLERLPAGIRVFGVHAPELRRRRAERAAARLLRRLRQAGAPPVVETPAGAATNGTGAAAVARAVGTMSRHEVLASSPWSTRALVRAYHAGGYFAEHARWMRAAARLGARVAAGTRPDVVVTSGPPHMVHVAGARIARSAGISLVTDLRDPWSLVERVPEWVASPRWYALSARHERRVLDAAGLVVLNTEASRSAYAALYPQLAARMVTVTNGADAEPLPRVERDPAFVVAFAGSIYLDRDPRVLFRGAATFVRELGLQPSQFRIRLIGNVDSYGGVAIRDMAREEGLDGFVETGPPRPRSAALEFLARASLLVSLPQDSDMAIPAKIFEYARFAAWLLIFARRGSATELLLRDTGADVVDPEDAAAVTAVLRRRYLEHAAGVRPTAIGADGRFDRQRQADILREAMERLVAR